MKSRYRLLLTTALLALTLGSAQAISYKGDGAIENASGGWASPTPDIFRTACLICHGGAMGPDKSSYLMTGHKNMLRKVTPGSPWAGADGTLYGTGDPGAYGQPVLFDWIAGTVSSTDSPPSISGGSQIYYIFGGWMDPTQLNTIFNGGFTGEISGDYGVQFPGGNYDCGRCHTTGYRFDNTGPEPTTYNGTPITDAQFSRYPTDYTTGTSSWYLTSVQCERCHRDIANEAGGHNCYIGGPTYIYSVAQYGTNINGSYNATYIYSWSCWAAGGSWTVVVPTLQEATALCIECHRQESADTSNNMITLSTDLAISGNSCSDGTSPDYPTCVANAGTWTAPFFDSEPGQTFLNSPHARFTGTMAQTTQNSPDLSVSMTGSYNSDFKDSLSGENKGCTGCHDVHQSIVPAVNASSPIVNKCTTCHTGGGSAPQVVVANILHPQTTGTPFENMAKDPESPCIICHMQSGAGTPIYHLMRINVDPSYSTFPPATYGPQIGNTASDGKIAAVWSDLDMACGQCHGGSAGSGATQNGAPYFDKATLAGYAANIHNNQAVNPSFTVSHGTNTMTAIVNASGSTCNGSNANCTAYSWNWGDGTPNGSGVTASHTYTNGAGEKVITLTVSQGVVSESRSEPFNAIAPPVAPVASGTISVSGWTYSLTDTSTGATAVNVSWGDGLNSTGCLATTCSHTYLNPGNYTITQTALNSTGQANVATYPANIAYLAISGKVTLHDGVTAVQGAGVILKLSGVIKAIVYTNSLGIYTASNLKPGTYSVYVSKAGDTFAVPAIASVSAPNASANVVAVSP